MSENRIFKFRQWDTFSKQFLTPETLPKNSKIFFHFKDDCFQFLGGKQVVFQQFTGLLDKNGKEIYEGDIVKYCGDSNITYSKPGEVSIGEYFTNAKEFCHYGIRVKRIDMNEFFGISGRDNKEYKIIGNFFENPELLKNE